MVAHSYGRKNQEKTGKFWFSHNEINNKVQLNWFFIDYFVLPFFFFKGFDPIDFFNSILKREKHISKL